MPDEMQQSISRVYAIAVGSTEYDRKRVQAPNRVAWLTAFIPFFRLVFEALHSPLQANIRVSCGFSKGARSAVAQVWAPQHSTGGFFEIFISPVLDDSVEAATALLHELVHVAVGVEQGHKGPFRDLALALGLQSLMTATTAGPELTECLSKLLDHVGPYPHHSVTDSSEPRASNAPPKQSTRLIKAQCPNSGYLIRLASKWLLKGLPTCPCGRVFESEC